MTTELPAKPADFEAFWADVDLDLGQYPARAVLNKLPRRSSDQFTVYWVELTSIGPCRIGGYLSIPTGDGPFPTLLQTPRYGSVNHVPHHNDRLRYVVLTLMHRGQRLTDQPFAASYPGQLTDGIGHPSTYIYRDIIADCLRGADFLLGRPEVDPERVAVLGDDLALITAARRAGFGFVAVSGVSVQRDALFLYRMLDAAKTTSAYPLEEINDYLRRYPDSVDNIRRTLAYIDPLHHMPVVTAKTRIDVKESGRIGGPEWVQPLADASGGPVELYPVTHEGGTDQDRLDAWLADQLGVPAMSPFMRR